MQNINNRNNVRIVLALIVAAALLFILAGCKTRKEIVTQYVEVHDTLYYEREYADTSVHFDADTASARLLVECDENNNALLSIVDQLTGDKTSLEALVRYYEETDKETGEKHRKAIIDITAVVQAQDKEIKILREQLAAANNSTRKDDKDKESEPTGLGWGGLLTAFALGISLTLAAIITIKSKSNV